MSKREGSKKWGEEVGGWLAVVWLLMRAYPFAGWRMRRWIGRFRGTGTSERRESIETGMKQTLLFIRHGQTTWNEEQKLPGQLPGIALTDKGKRQAAELAEALKEVPISAIISSPLERAVETAKYLTEGRELEIQLDPGLMDTDVGRWAGQNYNELSKNDAEWKAYVHNPTVAPEGVETFPEVQRRALAAVERWRSQETIGHFPAFVAHADIVKLLIAHYTGLPIERASSIFIDNASVSLLEIDPENIHSVRMIGIGWSPHPGWLKSLIEKPKKPETESDVVQDKAEQKT